MKRQKHKENVVYRKKGMGGRNCHPFHKCTKCQIWMIICCIGVAFSLTAICFSFYVRQKDDRVLKEQQKRLIEVKNSIIVNEASITNEKVISTKDMEQIEKHMDISETKLNEPALSEAVIETPVMLAEYQALYEKNTDMIGWLKIKDTNIDYPVMQTLEDETFYLKLDFSKTENRNGSLILDTDSRAGIGTNQGGYIGDNRPSTNLIIHGHTMKSGLMFGKLQEYSEKAYGDKHRIIQFDSLYEHRKYDLISAFYTKVYNNIDETFKYYEFFQANTQDEFDYWYRNIKANSLYDTEVEADFGDEFITLSCCAYHVEDGRFVVIGKRIE